MTFMADAVILYLFNFRPLHSMEIEYWFSLLHGSYQLNLFKLTSHCEAVLDSYEA